MSGAASECADGAREPRGYRLGSESALTNWVRLRADPALPRPRRVSRAMPSKPRRPAAAGIDGPDRDQPVRSITVTMRRELGSTMTILSLTTTNRHSGRPWMMRITSAGQLCRVTVAGSTTPVCTSKFTLVSGATCTLLKARVTCVRCSELKLTLEALVDPVVAPEAPPPSEEGPPCACPEAEAPPPGEEAPGLAAVEDELPPPAAALGLAVEDELAPRSRPPPGRRPDCWFPARLRRRHSSTRLLLQLRISHAYLPFRSVQRSGLEPGRGDTCAERSPYRRSPGTRPQGGRSLTSESSDCA